MTVLTTEEVIDEKTSDNKRKESLDIAFQKKSLWRVIARNEIRTRTSSFRNHRKLFFIALYSLLLIWAVIIAPYLFDLFMPTLAVQFSDVFKPVVAITIESLMMMLFIVSLSCFFSIISFNSSLSGMSLGLSSQINGLSLPPAMFPFSTVSSKSVIVSSLMFSIVLSTILLRLG